MLGKGSYNGKVIGKIKSMKLSVLVSKYISLDILKKVFYIMLHNASLNESLLSKFEAKTDLIVYF